MGPKFSKCEDLACVNIMRKKCQMFGPYPI